MKEEMGICLSSSDNERLKLSNKSVNLEDFKDSKRGGTKYSLL